MFCFSGLITPKWGLYHRFPSPGQGTFPFPEFPEPVRGQQSSSEEHRGLPGQLLALCRCGDAQLEWGSQTAGNRSSRGSGVCQGPSAGAVLLPGPPVRPSVRPSDAARCRCHANAGGNACSPPRADLITEPSLELPWQPRCRAGNCVNSEGSAGPVPGPWPPRWLPPCRGWQGSGHPPEPRGHPRTSVSRAQLPVPSAVAAGLGAAPRSNPGTLQGGWHPEHHPRHPQTLRKRPLEHSPFLMGFSTVLPGLESNNHNERASVSPQNAKSLMVHWHVLNFAWIRSYS